jgi:hypothetical protein
MARPAETAVKARSCSDFLPELPDPEPELPPLSSSSSSSPLEPEPDPELPEPDPELPEPELPEPELPEPELEPPPESSSFAQADDTGGKSPRQVKINKSTARLVNLIARSLFAALVYSNSPRLQNFKGWPAVSRRPAASEGKTRPRTAVQGPGLQMIPFTYAPGHGFP